MTHPCEFCHRKKVLKILIWSAISIWFSKTFPKNFNFFGINIELMRNQKIFFPREETINLIYKSYFLKPDFEFIKVWSSK